MLGERLLGIFFGMRGLSTPLLLFCISRQAAKREVRRELKKKQKQINLLHAKISIRPRGPTPWQVWRICHTCSESPLPEAIEAPPDVPREPRREGPDQANPAPLWPRP